MVSTDIAPKERYVVLDGMRGLAALIVITDHIHAPVLGGLFPGRYLAVDFFFVLSGFVLSHAYGERLARGLSTLAFMRIRLIRLYPLYLLGTLAGAALIAAQVVRGWADIGWPIIAATTGLSLVMLPMPPQISTGPYSIYPLDGPAWSLFFELFINAAFALFFLRLGPRVLAAILAVSALALAAATLHFGIGDLGFNWQNFIGGFPRVTFGFFAGVALHRLHLRRPLPALPAWAAFAALIAVLAFPAGDYRAPYDIIAALILFPIVVALSANARASGVTARAASFMGLVSYGVYILHVPIIAWLDTIRTALIPDLEIQGDVYFIVIAATAVLATAILHYLYDTPVRRWLSRRTKRG